MKMSFTPRILLKNQIMYLFSGDGEKAGMYDLNGNGKFHYISGMQSVMKRFLGIVLFKGRIIMLCRSGQMVLPPYTLTLNFYEFDERGKQWASKYEAIVSPEPLEDDVTCYAGGDYIWINEHDRDGYIISIIRVDLENGEANSLPGVDDYDGRNCVSMGLSFCPCSN